MQLNRLTGSYTSSPLVLPVSLADAKTYLRIDHSDEDSLITSLIIAAADWLEAYTHRGLLTQQWQMDLYRFPWFETNNPRARIYLPFGKCQSVDYVAYTDTAGATQTLAGPTQSPVGTGYQENLTGDSGGYIEPAYGDDWPDVREDTPGGVVIKFTVGYGATGASVPPALLQALKFRLADFYESRGQQDLRGQWQHVAEMLAAPYQIIRQPC